MRLEFSVKAMRLECVAVLAGAFLGPSALAQAPNTQKMKVLTLLGRPLQVVVAETHGLFAKAGVDVETENLPNSDVLRANLAAGKANLPYFAVDNPATMVESAHQDVVIVIAGEDSQ